MASLESRSRRGIVHYGRPAAGNPQRDVHLVKYSLQHQNPVFRVRQRYLTSQSLLQARRPTRVHSLAQSHSEVKSGQNLADSICATRGYEYVMLPLEAHDWNIPNRVTRKHSTKCDSVDGADTTHCSVSSTPGVPKSSSNRSVHKSSERYRAAMIPETQAVQNRYDGHVENCGRIVAHEAGARAHEALRGQKHHMLEEHQQIEPAEERDENSRCKGTVSKRLDMKEMPCMSEHCREDELQKNREAELRAQLQQESLMASGRGMRAMADAQGANDRSTAGVVKSNRCRHLLAG